MKRIVLFLCPIILLLSASFPAAAYDSSYVEDFAFWNSGEFEQEIAINEEYSSVLKYFTDDGCFYAHLSVLFSVQELNEGISGLNVSIHNEYNSYSMLLRENEIAAADELCLKNIEACSEFTPLSKYGRDMNFVLEFKNAKDRKSTNRISISVYANGVNYDIATTDEITFVSEESSTLERTTTANSRHTRESTEAKSTSKAGKSTTQGETKFSAFHSSTAARKYEATGGLTENETSTGASEPVTAEAGQTQRVVRPSRPAVIMISLAAVFALIACIFFTKAALRSHEADTEAAEKE